MKKHKYSILNIIWYLVKPSSYNKNVCLVNKKSQLQYLSIVFCKQLCVFTFYYNKLTVFDLIDYLLISLTYIQQTFLYKLSKPYNGHIN